ncbi:MAG: Flp family type IVb pilin [Erythrobacter sp.]
MPRDLISDIQSARASLTRCQRGAASIEFGLLAALIAVAAVQALSQVGATLGSTFETISTRMEAADELPPSNNTAP